MEFNNPGDTPAFGHTPIIEADDYSAVEPDDLILENTNTDGDDVARDADDDALFVTEGALDIAAEVPAETPLQTDATELDPPFWTMVKQLDSLEDEILPVHTRIGELMRGLPQDVARRVTARQMELSEAISHDPRENQYVAALLDAVQECVPDGDQQAFEPLADSIRAQVAEAVALEERVEELANARLTEAIAAMQANTDWPTIIAKSIADQDYGHSDLVQVLEAINPRPHYGQLECWIAVARLRYVEKLQSEISAAGDTRPAGKMQELPEDWQPNYNLEGEVRAWMESTHETFTFLTEDRRELIAHRLYPGIQLSKVVSLCESVGLTYDSARVTTVPPEIAYILETTFTDVARQFDIQDAASIEAPAATQTYKPHNAYGNKLTVAWLRKWLATARSEPDYFDERVTELYNHPSAEQRLHAKHEDLAVASDMYVHHPFKLLEYVPRRFAVLNERDGLYPEAAIRAVQDASTASALPDQQYYERYDAMLREHRAA